MSARLASVALLIGGLVVIVGAAAAGECGVLEAIVSPPPIVRAALVGAMVVVSVALGRASLARFVAAGAGGGGLHDADPIVLLRGIRLAFLPGRPRRRGRLAARQPAAARRGRDRRRGRRRGDLVPPPRGRRPRRP
jgi:hypothetical protein